MKYTLFGLLFLLTALSSCSTQEGSSTSSTDASSEKCNYDEHSMRIVVDSIVPVASRGMNDTSACADCNIIYYHSVAGEKFVSSCAGTVTDGESQLINGSDYYTNDFIQANDLVARGEYVMKVRQIVTGSCQPCIISFSKQPR